MTKIEISAEIGSKIKKFKQNYNIRSKDLANHICKSPAYITKLEKGDIKQLDRAEFEKILNFITKDKNGFEIFMKNISKEISIEELEKMTMFLNFDTVERKIPVSKNLVEFIELKLKEQKINIDTLVNYINLNEDISDETNKPFLDNKELKSNVWYPASIVGLDDKSYKHIIKLHFTSEQLQMLLSGNTDKSSYVFIFAVLYHLLKFENKKNFSILPDEERTNEIDKIKNETEKILDEYKFYNLSDRSKFAKQAENRLEYESRLSEFDSANLDLVRQLFSSIEILSNFDVKYVNDKLIEIVKNMSEDPSFALSYMAIPLQHLNNYDVNIKKKFLKDIQKLITNFDEEIDVKNNIEKY